MSELDAPAARPFPLFPYVLLALLSACVVAAGLGLMLWRQEPDLGIVREIRISAKPGIDIRKIEEVLDTPDYYLEVMSQPKSIRTATMEDTRVGNGLTFVLPVPMRVVDVNEVKVWDANSLGRDDRLVDRVDRPGRGTAGEKFQFDLRGEAPGPSKEWQVGLGLAIAGGAVLLLATAKFIRAQVV